LQDIWFQNGDVRLAASVGGNPSQPPVIFLHGAGQTRHSWRKAARALVEQGYYVVSMDHRGHGDSDWSPVADYSSDAFVTDVKAVISQLAMPPILIGASLGGLMSLVTVGESEQPLARALLLVDIAPKIDMEGRERIIGFMRSNHDGFTSADQAADAVSAYMPHRPRPSDSSGLLRNLRQKKDGRYYWHWDPAFFDSANATHNDPESRYENAAHNITIPTLLIRGERSELVSEASLKHFLEVIPTAEYVDVSGAHHMVVGDNNDAFTQAALEFLARLDDKPALLGDNRSS
jgi:pimeloyl-ACP methyl ester carboxylesterase